MCIISGSFDFLFIFPVTQQFPGKSIFFIAGMIRQEYQRSAKGVLKL
jgi:hypothetical protein